MYYTILSEILNGSDSNWQFCNRYFKGQEWKFALKGITGTWLGYDFVCLDDHRKLIADAVPIKKRAVNNVVDIFVLLIIMYLPLLCLFLPTRYQNNHNNRYRKGETPYSFTKVLLGLDTGETLFEEEFQPVKTIQMHLPEIKIISMFFFIISVVYCIPLSLTTLYQITENSLVFIFH